MADVPITIQPVAPIQLNFQTVTVEPGSTTPAPINAQSEGWARFTDTVYPDQAGAQVVSNLTKLSLVSTPETTVSVLSSTYANHSFVQNGGLIPFALGDRLTLVIDCKMQFFVRNTPVSLLLQSDDGLHRYHEHHAALDTAPGSSISFQHMIELVTTQEMLDNGPMFLFLMVSPVLHLWSLSVTVIPDGA